ncbi:MAG TPA: transposase [Candidatus Sulfotelmatobacter sp.]|nr:transposase [Candidatus Sulfotelmatobacter sp.]
MRGRWELSDAQWKLIEPILRLQRRADDRGRPWQDTRAVLNGILWVLGTGAQWRELPNKYPPYQTCHRRFQQWVRAGKLERILRVLAEELQARGKLDLEEAFIDASFTGAKKGGLGHRRRRWTPVLMRPLYNCEYVGKSAQSCTAGGTEEQYSVLSTSTSRDASQTRD